MFNKPKLLTGLDQKVSGQVQGLQRSSAADVAPPAQRHDLTRSVASAERGKPVALPSGVGCSQERPTGLRVEEEGGSECRPVMDWIGVATSSHPKGGRLPSGVGGRETPANRRREQSRTVGEVAMTFAGAAPATW